MNDIPAPAAAPANPNNNFLLVRDWLVGAWRLFRRDPWLWVGIAVFYFLAAILLKRIPLMGNLVLLLLTPIPLASTLIIARDAAASPPAPAPAIPASWPDRARFFLQRPLTDITRSLDQEGFGFPVALLCIVVLGLGMIAVIFEHVVAGGSVISGIGGARYSGGGLRVTTVIGMVLALIVYGALLISLFFLVPLTLFRQQPVVQAITDSFLTWRRTPKPLTLFTGLFLVAYALIAIAFGSSSTHWLGYLLVFSVGVLLLPMFVIGSYLSYRTLHGEPPAAGVRSL